MVKKSFAQVMKEATASADYRRVKSEMMKLARTFSKQRYVMIFNPDEQTLDMFRDEEFTVEKTKIKEYNQYKISW